MEYLYKLHKIWYNYNNKLSAGLWFRERRSDLMLDFSVRSLEAFYAVAKHLSFTAAADKLFISQSSVSKMIAKLESSLNTQLLNRSSHSVVLTADGQMLYEELAEILPRLEQVVQNMGGSGASIKENLVLSIPPRPVNGCRTLLASFTPTSS